MNMVLDDYDDQMIAGDACGLNFLTFVLRLRKYPGKNLNQETDPTGIEPGTTGLEEWTLPLDHSDGRKNN